jgi:rhodanese-related sulfurtransferase
MVIKEITPLELKRLQDNQEPFVLVDVREPFEFHQANLGGRLIPLGLVEHQAADFQHDIPVVVCCRSGKRSANAIAYLQSKHGYDNLFNLAGGLIAYARDVDPTLQVL